MAEEKLKYAITPIKLSVHLKDVSPIFGEQVTHVSLDDEGAGMFIVLEQDNADGVVRKETNRIRIDFDEFAVITSAIKQLEQASKKLD